MLPRSHCLWQGELKMFLMELAKHLVLLLSLLCVLLLSHFVAGNKVHGWIFKFHSVLLFIVCMLCLLLVHVYYSVGFKRLLELVL